MTFPSNAGHVVKQAVQFVAAVLFVASLTAARVFAQQVGYTPEESPYRDVVSSQHLTAFGGYYHAGKDEVGAAPGSAPIVGLRYELDIAGPAQFWARTARVFSQRNAFNPTLPVATRSLGKVDDALFLTDVGFSLNLTGRKSWHSLVPVIGFGIGVASAGAQVADDPYRFGSQFLFSTQLGVRVVPPSNRYELRLMLDNTFYQNHYPSNYFVPAAGGTTPILGTSVSRSSYLANFALTAGLSVPLFR